MRNDVHVINKSENDLIVTVDNVNGDIQIIIDTKKKDIDLLSFDKGDIFNVDDVDYIVLEQLNGNQTAVIRKELLEDEKDFDPDNNNWNTSSIQKLLNNDYLEEIEKAFGKDRIVEHTVDLLSLDGLDDYGESTNKVSLLTIDQYRKYRKVLGSNLDRWWWLITPNSTLSGCGSRCVQCVDSCGDVDYFDCVYGRGVRPFFILQS